MAPVAVPIAVAGGTLYNWSAAEVTGVLALDLEHPADSFLLTGDGPHPQLRFPI